MLSWDSFLRNTYRVLSLVAQDVKLELNFASVKNVSSDMRVRVCNPSTWEGKRENWEFRAILDSIRLCLKTSKTKKTSVHWMWWHVPVILTLEM